jgi:hypothetical protein
MIQSLFLTIIAFLFLTIIAFINIFEVNKYWVFHKTQEIHCLLCFKLCFVLNLLTSLTQNIIIIEHLRIIVRGLC